MDCCRVDFEALPWQSPTACVRFKAVSHGGRRLRLVEFARGFVEPDWCRNGHIGYVLEGTMDLAFEGGTVRYGPGDGLFIPSGPDHQHKAVILSDVVRVVLVEDA